MDPGSVAAWVSAVFTGLGLGGAVLQLRAGRVDRQQAREQARRDEELRREVMARAVGVKTMWQPSTYGEPAEGDSTIPIDVEVMNAGSLPIEGVVLVIDADHQPMEVVYGTVLPGEHLKDRYDVARSHVGFSELMVGATVLFTDAYGTHWARSNDGLERRDASARIC